MRGSPCAGQTLSMAASSPSVSGGTSSQAQGFSGLCFLSVSAEVETGLWLLCSVKGAFAEGTHASSPRLKLSFIPRTFIRATSSYLNGVFWARQFGGWDAQRHVTYWWVAQPPGGANRSLVPEAQGGDPALEDSCGLGCRERHFPSEHTSQIQSWV